MNFHTIGIIILGILFLLVIGTVVDSTYAESHIEEVDCYDRWGNKIQGAICDEEVYDSWLMQNLDIIMIFGMMLMFLFMVVIVSSFDSRGGYV